MVRKTLPMGWPQARVSEHKRYRCLFRQQGMRFGLGFEGHASPVSLRVQTQVFAKFYEELYRNKETFNTASSQDCEALPTIPPST